jgi:hypothetical protein
MSFDLSLHNLIEKCNVLQKPTEQINEYLIDHPNLHKVVLLTNHIFRAASMVALSLLLPFSAPVNILICFAGSLFYRLTVETHCAYKYALPAFAGSIAFPIALPALTNLVSGVAFASLSAFGLAFVTLLPLAAYFTYIALTVNYDVDNRRQFTM